MTMSSLDVGTKASLDFRAVGDLEEERGQLQLEALEVPERESLEIGTRAREEAGTGGTILPVALGEIMWVTSRVVSATDMPAQKASKVALMLS